MYFLNTYGSINSVPEINPFSDIISDDEDWTAIVQKAGEIHLEDFLCVNNRLGTSEIFDVDIIENRAASDKGGDEVDNHLTSHLPHGRKPCIDESDTTIYQCFF